MTPERLTGLDASFLYMETPTLHMHVAMTAVFDPSTVPGRLLLPAGPPADQRPASPSPRSSSGASSRCPCGSATRSGSTTPSSTSTTTCAGRRSRRRAACASWATSPPT